MKLQLTEQVIFPIAFGDRFTHNSRYDYQTERPARRHSGAPRRTGGRPEGRIGAGGDDDARGTQRFGAPGLDRAVGEEAE
jgi:hypothetical protein